MTWIRAHSVAVGSTVFASLIALVIAAFFFFLQQENTALSVVLLANTNLVSDEAKVSERINIMFEEEVVPELWFASLELVNNGNTAIRRNDFDGPVALNIADLAILDLIQGEHSPSHLQPEIIQSSDSTVVISPILLNSGDSIAFSVFATRPITLEQLVATSRIAGVNSIVITSSVQTAGGTFNLTRSIMNILGGFGTAAIILVPIYFWNLYRKATEMEVTIGEMKVEISGIHPLQSREMPLQRGEVPLPDDQGHLEQP